MVGRLWGVRRENWEFQDCRATQEDKVQKVRLDSQDFQERMARKEGQEVNAAQEDPQGKPGLRDHLDLRDQWDLLDPRDPLAQLARTAYLDILGNEVK
eukprot:g44302.t1